MCVVMTTVEGNFDEDHFIKGICNFMNQEINSQRSTENEINPIIAKYVKHFLKYEYEKKFMRGKQDVLTGKW